MGPYSQHPDSKVGAFNCVDECTYEFLQGERKVSTPLDPDVLLCRVTPTGDLDRNGCPVMSPKEPDP